MQGCFFPYYKNNNFTKIISSLENYGAQHCAIVSGENKIVLIYYDEKYRFHFFDCEANILFPSIHGAHILTFNKNIEIIKFLNQMDFGTNQKIFYLIINKSNNIITK